MKNYLKGFNQYAQVNEMASELTKLGVPKDLMQFIHKLTGQKVSRTKSGMMRGGKFRTLHGEYGGDWPETQDDPLSHDVSVVGSKTGLQRIYDYLVNSIDKRTDTKVKLILVNPDEQMVHYITRKTGKTQEWKGYDPDRPNVSQKRGNYIRIVTIDRETGEPVAAWRGTIEQLRGDITDNSVLYIMEDESRAQTKRESRAEGKKMTDQIFLDYFKKEYMNIITKVFAKKETKKKEEFQNKLSQIDPEQLQGFGSFSSIGSTGPLAELINAAKEVQSGSFSEGQLTVELRKFLEYLGDKGDYAQTKGAPAWDKRASIESVVERHSLMGACSKFLQFIATGKTASVYTDIFKELGLEELGLGGLL
jgi:hypothetical protein